MYTLRTVGRIRKVTLPSQWNYVPTSINPADLGTRSISSGDLQESTWIHGPIKFLSRQENSTDQEDYTAYIDSDADKEVRPLISVAKTLRDSIKSEPFVTIR